MTLYLKYRPKTLEELDLEEVRESLKKTVKSDNIPHAFLFSGPKGTGKTSAARLIAKIVNCEKRKKGDIEPCNKCDQCKSIDKGSNIDVVELDAASHRGIDDIRQLREAVKLSPSKSEKKVYILDEAHMLTTEASNALLKTLEEPPEHVIFILATTNPEKIIDTIRSRATTVSFKKAGNKEVLRSLKRVVKGEKIKVDDEALKLIAKSARGSFRDAIKTLEQLTSQSKKITKDSVETYLYGSGESGDVVPYLVKKDAKGALKEIEKVVNHGHSLELYTENLLERLREKMLSEVGVGKSDLEGLDREDVILLIKKINEAHRQMQGALIEQLPLEVAIVEWCGEVDVGEGESENGEVKSTKNGKSGKKKLNKSKSATQKEDEFDAEDLKENFDQSVWNQILKEARPQNTSIEALLRAAKPLGFDGERLTLGVFYSFHKERLEESHHRRVLEEIIAKVVGKPVRVTCRLTEPPRRKVQKKEDVVLTEGDDEDIIKVAEEVFSN